MATDHIAVRSALEGVANVHRPTTNCGPTISGLELLDGWLTEHGERPWDVIHYQFGLHDLKRMEGGDHQVPPAEYAANLRTITHALAKTGAALIWCSTTPVPDVPMDAMSPPRLVSDVLLFNAAAFEAVNASTAVGGVAVHDLYSYLLRIHCAMRQKIQHFTNYIWLHYVLKQSICSTVFWSILFINLHVARPGVGTRCLRWIPFSGRIMSISPLWAQRTLARVLWSMY